MIAAERASRQNAPTFWKYFTLRVGLQALWWRTYSTINHLLFVIICSLSHCFIWWYWFAYSATLSSCLTLHLDAFRNYCGSVFKMWWALLDVFCWKFSHLSSKKECGKLVTKLPPWVWCGFLCTGTQCRVNNFCFVCFCVQHHLWQCAILDECSTVWIWHVNTLWPRVVSSEISLGKFPEIYSNLSGNVRKFVK